MSFVFRGTRGDIETGFPDFIPERRAVVISYYLLIFLLQACYSISILKCLLIFLNPKHVYVICLVIRSACSSSTNQYKLTCFSRHRYLSFIAICLVTSFDLLISICNRSFYISVFLLFMILNSHQMSPNFLVSIIFTTNLEFIYFSKK